MAEQTFRAVIAVIDRASAPLRHINARLEGLRAPAAALRAPVAQLGAEMRRLGENIGLRRVADAAGRARAALAGAAGAAATMLPALAAFGGAGAAGGLLAFATGAATAAGELEDLATRTGASIADLDTLRFAGRMTGVEMETLGTGMARLRRTMTEALTGNDAVSADMFRQLNIPLRDASGRARDAAAVMVDLGERMAGMSSAANRAAVAQQAFGKAGTALIPMLAELPEHTAEARRQLALAGGVPVFTREQLARTAQFGDAMDSLGMAATNLRNAIGRELAPVLQPAVEGLRDLFVTGREGAAGSVRDLVAGLGRDLAALNAGPAGEAIRTVASAAGALVERMGGARTVILGVGALLGGALVVATGKAVLAIGAFALGPVVALAKVAALVLALNPIVLAGAAAVGVAAFLARRHWDAIAGWARRSAEDIRNAWRPIGRFFADLWGSLARNASDAWRLMRPVVESITGAARALTGGGGTTNPQMQAPAQQERQNRFGTRGNLGGFPPRPPAVGPQSSLQGGGSRDVTVRFVNAPPGTRVALDGARGPASPRFDVGFAFA